jgi:hypothetical protein
VNIELVKLTDLSGRKASIWTIYLKDENLTLFDRFLTENEADYPAEINHILDSIETIANRTGVIEPFLVKPEGRLGDNIYALYDKPDSNLRLYFIKMSKTLIILGGGGSKPKDIASFQEDEKLKKENYLLRDISKIILERIKDREIFYSKYSNDVEGNFYFNDED